MKRYLLFSGVNYYPEGGVYDLQGDFDTLEQAVDHLAGLNIDNQYDNEWAHIIDTHHRHLVLCLERSTPYGHYVQTKPNRWGQKHLDKVLQETP